MLSDRLLIVNFLAMFDYSLKQIQKIRSFKEQDFVSKKLCFNPSRSKFIQNCDR